jgi:hypothetical protein
MDKGRLVCVKGDTCEPQRIDKDEIVVIPHCCNNEGKWGAGFVLALSKKWVEPEVYYKEFCKRNSGIPILGRTNIVTCEKTVIVANMIAQDGIISKDNPKPIKYKALVNCMADVAAFIQHYEVIIDYAADIQHCSKPPIRIHCCRFGSERAGGTWNFIVELIDELWLSQCIDVIVYEYEPNKDEWGPIDDYSMDAYSNDLE